MNFNLVFKLYKDTIIISEIKKDVNYESLNNTNVIDVKELKFSNDYIIENFELVANFLNVVIIKNNITNVQINNMDVASLCMDLINEWEHIKKITFKPDKKLSMEVYLKILDNDYIEEINCYELASYLVERLDLNKNTKVITRHETEYTSRFMKENFLNSYSDIYYKKCILVNGDLEKNEIDELKEFIALNNRLKTIRIINYSNEILAILVQELENYKIKNVLIQIDEKNNDLNVIYNSVNYIKKSYKKYFDEYNIKFKLNYSKEYKKNNFMKAFNIKLFTIIVLLIALVFAITIGINYYNQYIDQNKIEDQLNEIEQIFEEAEEVIEPTTTAVKNPDVITTTVTTTKKKGTSYASAYYTNYKQVFKELLKKNKDTVGWLSVKNTKINYPVVQAKTNSYYLNRDYNKRKNSMGWIFMDYRNNPKDLDQNTIIYGHNIKQGIMFGTIKKMMNASWYKKEENRIITFNTPTANMKWKIFSLYKIKPTEDYLQNEFENNDEFNKFIKMIKKRSIYDFKVDIPEDAKIITLSTCFSSNTRHVVHAVLIEKKEDTKEEVKKDDKTTTTTKKSVETTTTKSE